MRGNIFIAIPLENVNDLVPIDRYNYEVENLEKETIIHQPTWAEIGLRNKQMYGVVLEKKYQGKMYHIFELGASWLKGEVSILMALGKGKAAPAFALLEAAEVHTFNWDVNTNELV
tara:strand:- start:406 stop:753 length:348 start_codon:yes stop_codon:yes gene_type:complete